MAGYCTAVDKPLYHSLVAQAGEVRAVIAGFSRHPHRNAILGRTSTPAEVAWLTEGAFPHQRALRG